MDNKKCQCPPCPETVTTRLQAKLSFQQVDMLGFFCSQCILANCDFRHKVRQ